MRQNSASISSMLGPSSTELDPKCFSLAQSAYASNEARVWVLSSVTKPNPHSSLSSWFTWLSSCSSGISASTLHSKSLEYFEVNKSQILTTYILSSYKSNFWAFGDEVSSALWHHYCKTELGDDQRCTTNENKIIIWNTRHFSSFLHA